MHLHRSSLLRPACLLAALLFASCAAQADDAKLVPQLDDLASVPLLVTPPAATAKALAAVTGNKSQPLRFAVGVPLSLTLADGRWDEPSAGLSRWRSRVFSSTAKSLSFEFAEFALPPGAELWLYDVKGALVQGPYTHANETPEGKLWTALVQSDTAVLELRVPTPLRDAVRLKLGEVDHGFIEFSKAGEVGAKSASCNIDVVCSQGNNWRDEIRSVARIVISGQFLCSAQLVNNVRQDNAPLLLTANHCMAAAASSVMAYWNYQTSSCGGTPNGSLSQNQGGASLLATDRGSDFTLLQLNQTPPSSFGVYYAGWNASNAVPQSGVAIHHPSGDEKRISVYNAPGQRSTVTIDGNIVQAWAVNWAQGTTETGSSGSGLWNEQHQIVGVLSGGPTDTCETGPDQFGRLEVGWTASSLSTGQLKAHLDPDNTGRLAMCGKNPGSSCTPPGEAVTPGGVAGAVQGGGGGAFGLLALLFLGSAPFLRRGRSA